MAMFIGRRGEEESPNFEMILDYFKTDAHVLWLLSTYLAQSL